MDNNELKHHGTKGMRWGIRRYQNKDGSLTPAGRKRYDSEIDRLNGKEQKLKAKQQLQTKKQAISDLKRQTKNEKLAAKEQRLKDKLETREKKKEISELKKQLSDKSSGKSKTDTPETKPVNKSLKDMSDEELRAKINRIDMEKRYADLTKTQKTRGHKFVKTVLSDMLAPAAVDLGKQFIKSALTKAINEKVDMGDEYKLYTNNKKK